VLDRIVEGGFDSIHGARPLRYAIQTGGENPLARKIPRCAFVSREVIVVDATLGELGFRRSKWGRVATGASRCGSARP
jgi:ATP-dependent Clp protease ATP-binding subunit ClpB